MFCRGEPRGSLRLIESKINRIISPIWTTEPRRDFGHLRGGSIEFGLAAAIDCVIRNMSETGAALEVETPVGIPNDFTLLMKPEFVKRNCRVAWRSAKRIAVLFV